MKEFTVLIYGFNPLKEKYVASVQERAENGQSAIRQANVYFKELFRWYNLMTHKDLLPKETAEIEVVGYEVLT